MELNSLFLKLELRDLIWLGTFIFYKDEIKISDFKFWLDLRVWKFWIMTFTHVNWIDMETHPKLLIFRIKYQLILYSLNQYSVLINLLIVCQKAL